MMEKMGGAPMFISENQFLKKRLTDIVITVSRLNIIFYDLVLNSAISDIHRHVFPYNIS